MDVVAALLARGSRQRRKRKTGEHEWDENWQNCCVFELSQRIHGSSFLFPRYVDSAIRGSGRGEEPSGENVLRLIQIRLMTRVWKKSRLLVKPRSEERRVGKECRSRWSEYQE